jgi:tetraacyldisaccharide 4'-kinase
MRLFIEQLWSATSEGKSLTRRAFFFWQILKFFSVIYIIALLVRRLVLSFKKAPRATLPGPVIAVGNLTVGGTGKSVFVEWLARQANFFDRPAVLLSGYQSSVLRKQKAFVVSNGHEIFGDAAQVGDESLQIVEGNGVAAAIGKDRYEALLLLLLAMKPMLPDAVILDDGYQTATIHKDCSILLVDARAPFGNGYLFPAGPLRERDYSRADIIVLTHADLASIALSDLKKRYFPSLNPIAIVAGRHAFAGLFSTAGESIEISREQPVVLSSGIARPENIVTTVRGEGFIINDHIIFPDHHLYTDHDIKKIITRMQKVVCSTLLTTAKDWTKLRAFSESFDAAGILCLVVKIRFEFLTSHEYATFVALLQNVLVEGRAAQ